MLDVEDRTKNLLLISCSTIYGRSYLDHVESDIRDLLKGVQRVAFIPFALFDRDAYAAKAGERFRRMGFVLESAHNSSAPSRLIESAEAIFIGGGNTFRLLKALQDCDLLEIIQGRVE